MIGTVPVNKELLTGTVRVNNFYLILNILRKTEFRKGPKVYQRRLEEIEEKAYTREQKVEIIRSLKNPSHEYLSFFVCRNPVEKLVSVFKYMKVLR